MVLRTLGDQAKQGLHEVRRDESRCTAVPMMLPHTYRRLTEQGGLMPCPHHHVEIRVAGDNYLLVCESCLKVIDHDLEMYVKN